MAGTRRALLLLLVVASLVAAACGAALDQDRDQDHDQEQEQGRLSLFPPEMGLWRYDEDELAQELFGDGGRRQRRAADVEPPEGGEGEGGSRCNKSRGRGPPGEGEKRNGRGRGPPGGDGPPGQSKKNGDAPATTPSPSGAALAAEVSANVGMSLLPAQAAMLELMQAGVAHATAAAAAPEGRRQRREAEDGGGEGGKGGGRGCPPGGELMGGPGWRGGRGGGKGGPGGPGGHGGPKRGPPPGEGGEGGEGGRRGRGPHGFHPRECCPVPALTDQKVSEAVCGCRRRMREEWKKRMDEGRQQQQQQQLEGDGEQPPPRNRRGPGKWGPPPKERGCVDQCVMTNLTVATADAVDFAKLAQKTEELIRANAADEEQAEAFVEAAKKALDTCKGKAPQPKEDQTCKSGAGEASFCFRMELFMNCPTAYWNGTAECNSMREHIASKRGGPPPPPED